jgi:hypothetical protein
MRLNSAAFAIDDDRTRVRGQSIRWNWRPIRCSNFTSNNATGNEGRASSTTSNQLGIPHRILYLNILSQIHLIRCDFSKNTIPILADCLSSGYRRTEAEYFNFDQCAGDDIQLSTKFSQIRIRAWHASGWKSKKAYCSWSRFWPAISWLHSTKLRK